MKKDVHDTFNHTGGMSIGEGAINMIECRPYIWTYSKPSFDRKSIKDLEQSLNISFPFLFMEVFEASFGDKPLKSVINMGDKNCVVAHFLHAQSDTKEDVSLYSINEQKEEIDEFLSGLFVPFMITYDSNLVCLNFTDSRDSPSVYLVISGLLEDGEDKSIRYICKDFETFLNTLTSADSIE